MAHTTNDAHKPANRLIQESSPYLLQHARNPVDWYPWGEEALAKARAENKMLIISVGYSACHWCHVMEKESFEDAEVADWMNRYFVSIKVDREERPDIDQIYMDAAQLVTGRGGWPLNAIALPDGRPVYAGTYFPKDQWIRVLQYFINTGRNDRENLLQRAADITRGIREMDELQLEMTESAAEQHTDQKAVAGIMAHADQVYGGRLGAPKFIMPAIFRFLLSVQSATPGQQVRDYIHDSLGKIRRSGIYDACGGGFFRYSVDESWTIPHFEKMLYDQAQLIGLYAQAYAQQPSEEYKSCVYETISFLNRELKDSYGGYYAALDADSEGEEGKYYVWSEEELQQLLGSEMSAFRVCYPLSRDGNFEGLNHLCRTATIAAVAEKNAWGVDEFRIRHEEWMLRLLTARANRVRPGLDDKVLASWNALTVLGMLDAAAVFSDDHIGQQALHTLSFIRREMTQDDVIIFRSWKNNQARIPGFLDDYAAVISAAIRAFQFSGQEDYAYWALQLTLHCLDYFWDSSGGLFYFTSSADQPLIARKKEMTDTVIPSSNALMAANLVFLGHLFFREDFLEKARAMRHRMLPALEKNPVYHAQWAQVAGMLAAPLTELVIAGDQALSMSRKWIAAFHPRLLVFPCTQDSAIPLLIGKYKAGITLGYICHNKQCLPPLADEEEWKKIIK